MDYDDVEDLVDIADRVYAGAARMAAKHGFAHLEEAANSVPQADPEDVTAAALLDLVELGLSAEQADKALIAATITYNLCATIKAIAEAALAPDMGEEDN